MVEMSRGLPELDRVRVVVSDDVRDRHLAAISDAIRTSRTASRLRRFRLLAVAVAVVLALPVMALASENALPGDLLYPIKRMLEPLVSVVDRDVEADHRVREAEALLERDAEPRLIRDHVDRARIVITDEHPEHVARLDAVADELERRHLIDESDGQPPASEPSDEELGDRQRRDDSTEPLQPDAGSKDEPVETLDPAPGTTTTTTHDRTTTATDSRRDG